jgi:putative heme iron utilization protein
MAETASNRTTSAFLCRRLARAARKAYLCTIGAESQPDTAAWPSASLITVTAAWDSSPILLLSGLAHHTRNIAADGRAAILFDGTAGYANPQQGPRAAFMGRFKPAKDKRLHQRFLARHPAAAQYAGFGDFEFYRMQVERVHYVGGFAAAQWLKGGRVTLAAGDCKPIADMEAGALEHMNRDHAGAVADYGTRLLGKRGKYWRLIGLDPEGCDLACGNGVHRLDFETRVTDAAGMREQLVELAEMAKMAKSGNARR